MQDTLYSVRSRAIRSPGSAFRVCLAALVAILGATGTVVSVRAEAAGDSAPAVVQVGQKAPDFTLQDTDGQTHQLSQLLADGKTVVLEWFNPDCPFIKRHHLKDKDMTRLYNQFKDQNVVWLAINSGTAGAQGAGLERNAKAKKDYAIDYPILLDESGNVGRAYGAKTTPDMFVIRKDGILIYSGAIDDDPRGEKTDKTNYVEAALTSCMSGTGVQTAETKSYGCSVKYSQGKKTT